MLLVTADQFRADSLSCAGHPTVRTPVLDQFAREGVRFAQHYTNCPPCGPSRTSLLTGMYQMNHRSVRNGTPLDASFTNLAEAVRTVGYEPWLIGYTDTTMDPRRYHPRDPRIGRYEEILTGMMQFTPGSEWGTGDKAWRNMLKQKGYQGWQSPYEQPEHPLSEERGPTFAPSAIKPEDSDTAFARESALRFLSQMENEEPWFLHLSYLRPHPPLVATEPWNAMYEPEEVPDFIALDTLEEERAMHPYVSFRLDRLEQNPKLPAGTTPNENRAWRQARATYYGLISELDHHFGRVLEALKASGADKNTLVIFMSDHGEMLGDHWCWRKELPFDAAVRVPLIIRSPLMTEAARGSLVEDFTEHVDIMPTILEHLGVDVPPQCDGHSLIPFLKGEIPVDWRKAVHWELDFRDVETGAAEKAFGIRLDECHMSAIRLKTAKYVHFAALPPLYFDIAKDPGELRNLSSDPAYAQDILTAAQDMLDLAHGL